MIYIKLFRLNEFPEVLNGPCELLNFIIKILGELANDNKLFRLEPFNLTVAVLQADRTIVLYVSPITVHLEVGHSPIGEVTLRLQVIV